LSRDAPGTPRSRGTRRLSVLRPAQERFAVMDYEVAIGAGPGLKGWRDTLARLALAAAGVVLVAVVPPAAVAQSGSSPYPPPAPPTSTSAPVAPKTTPAPDLDAIRALIAQGKHAEALERLATLETTTDMLRLRVEAALGLHQLDDAFEDYGRI